MQEVISEPRWRIDDGFYSQLPFRARPPSLHFTQFRSRCWLFPKDANVLFWLFPRTDWNALSLCASKSNPMPLSRSLSPIYSATYFMRYSVDLTFSRTSAPPPFSYHRIKFYSSKLPVHFICLSLGVLTALHSVLKILFAQITSSMCRLWKHVTQIFSCGAHIWLAFPAAALLDLSPCSCQD